MYVNTLNNTNKEHLVITLYHNKILHTIHKKFFLSPYFLTSENNSFQTQKTIRKVAIKTVVREPCNRSTRPVNLYTHTIVHPNSSV